MKLIGMLDSPYVRRSAIAATLLGVKIDHESVSVFRHMPRFAEVNPLLKAPSAIADDGTVLMDSALVLQHIEDVAGRSLRPADPRERTMDLRLTGIGVNICDKAVGVEYERKRPEDKRYAPWFERIQTQLHDALAMAETLAAAGSLRPGAGIRHGDIAVAVGYAFTQFVIPEHVPATRYPALAAFSAACEATPAFRAWPIDRE